MSKKIGFIGLGIMGKPMSKNLLKAGYDLTVCDINASAVAEVVALGAKAASTPKEVAAQTEIIITMLPNSPQVKTVVLGENGVIEGAKPGTIVVDMSSIAPLAAQEVAKALAEKKVEMLDAPVSGGEPKAIDATLSIMVGGEASTFEQIHPLLARMGKNITHVGPAGTGQTAKVANQIIVALNIEAVAEALVFAAKAGADPARVREALMGGFAASRILEVHGERMIRRTFAPGFRIGLHQKDLNLALSSARALGVALPNTATAQELFNVCAAQGGRDWDHSALVRALETMSNASLVPATECPETP